MTPGRTTPSGRHADGSLALDGRSAGQRYLDVAQSLVARLLTAEWPQISAAADIVADRLAAGGTIHAFGSGHSHMLAEELFYRAGGFVRVRPILFEGLMLHASAPLSTSLERMPGLGRALLDDHGVGPTDVLVAISNSGGNAVTTEIAEAARAAGLAIVAITSLRHATSARARSTESPRLHAIADIVIDNGGAVGDAAVEIAGLERPVAPTSTVVGAAILNAIVAEAAERLVARGVEPEVFASSNVVGGDARNAAFLGEGSS